MWQRLVELLEDPSVSVARVAAVIGQHVSQETVTPWSAGAANPPRLIEGEDMVSAKLDELASGLSGSASCDDVIDYVFGVLAFHGNRHQYYEPDNSIIQRVIETRRGVPISLAVVAIEIGIRADVVLSPIGMPGHFLLGDGYSPERFFDPFMGGRQLDVAGCRRIFEHLMPTSVFDTTMLRPVDATSIAARVLQNLRVVYLRQGDVARLASVLQLRVELDGASNDERLEYSKVLGALGRSDQAAEQLEQLAVLDPERAEKYLKAACRHHARRN